MASIETSPLQRPWQTDDPFLFCMHHDDRYPAGNEDLGPDTLLEGRNLGNDFSDKDGWSMYHGQTVPGFPQHPHVGFETITIVRNGFIDHTDSLGAKARFGEGDVQWMTAGNGVVHSEMFPLLNQDGPNRTELFQIWLNLPREDKRKDPYFTMFWNDDIPCLDFEDDSGRMTEVIVIAGALEDTKPLSPPPTSWASREESDVAVWLIRMEPEASFELPDARAGTRRSLYLFEGQECTINEQRVIEGNRIQVPGNDSTRLENGAEPAEFLLLQGRPIDEPVIQQGPFVAASQGEMKQAMLKYRKTQFGGWPWDADAPVHPKDSGRFAVHADGAEERPGEN